MRVCRFCNQEIIWTPRPNGKKLPVDPERVSYRDVKSGYYFITDDDSAIRVTRDKDATLGHVKGRVSHISTCTGREDIRKN